MARLSQSLRPRVFVALFVGAAALPLTVLADNTEPAGELALSQSVDSGDSGGGSGETQQNVPGWLSKFEMHGFLSQAYVDGKFLGGRVLGPGGADPGPTFDELALGIPEDGTFDYRTMALQFRYQITSKDLMVVQLSSRSLGDSPISDLEEEVELDWAFYERRIGDNTAVKIGRVQIPIGIFNEIRDVGTILPFYRPSFVFYREGTFTTETVDGFLINHTFWPDSDWSLETDVYVGYWEEFELTPIATQRVTIAEDEGYGLQLWLNTPLSGLRIGYGAHVRETTKGAEGLNREIGGETDFFDWYASIDGVFERWVARAEYREFENDPAPFPGFFAQRFESKQKLSYAQVGFHVSDQFRVYVQAEFSTSENSADVFVSDFDIDFREDYGVALNYLFSPNAVFKVEYHEVDGEDLNVTPVFTPTGLKLQLDAVPLDSGNYYIVSFSASF